MIMIDQDVTSFPSDELLAQVDDSVLSKFICDFFSRLLIKLHVSFIGIVVCVILVTLRTTPVLWTGTVVVARH